MKDLKDLRVEIDAVDSEITRLLEQRFDIVREVGRYKERKGLPILDASREQEKIEKLKSLCESGKAPYAAGVFEEIMAQSRAFQQDHKLQYGLLGSTLGHSYSPQMHKIIGGYEYGLYERRPEQLDEFFSEGTFKGISVTMPYKRDVIKYCSELSEQARRCGSVNTIVRREDGTYYGDNTDYYGFRSTVESSGIDVAGAKTIVLGSGGVSGTVINVMKDLGADPVTVISRTGPDNYTNLERHYDAQIIVNTTPLGMYPNAGEAAIDIRDFPDCRAVFDLIYNPLRTRLMLDARKAGIPAFGGLQMLAAQAAKASQMFLGEDMDLEAKTDLAVGRMRQGIENIVLIGMPGCGKTTKGRKLAELTGRTFIDCDDKIREDYGRTPERIIKEDGIDHFRDLEVETIRKVMRRGPDASGDTPGIIFATGGGCVEREENMVPLLENSFVVYLKRELSQLPRKGRPVSQTDGTEAIFERRREAYESWSDFQVDCNRRAAEEILDKFLERNQL